MQHYGLDCVNIATLRTVLGELCNITDCTLWTMQHYGLDCV